MSQQQASTRLEAPRPPKHWKPSVPSSRIGTTITTMLGASVKTLSEVETSVEQRPLCRQPCTVAAASSRPVLPNHAAALRRTRSVSLQSVQGSLSRCPRAASINPPGTRPHVAPKSFKSGVGNVRTLPLSNSVFQRALWADIIDDEDDNMPMIAPVIPRALSLKLSTWNPKLYLNPPKVKEWPGTHKNSRKGHYMPLCWML